MKKREILKQSYEVTSDFDTAQMITALKAQVDSKIFTELIRNENPSLTLEFKVFVNEEEEEDYKDKEKLKSLRINNTLLKFLNSKEFEDMEQKPLSLYRLYMELGDIDFTLVNKLDNQQ